MQHELPVVGAAMRLASLPQHIDWLVADQRDLEINDPGYYAYLDGDWQAEARAGRALLTERGYSGRLGIHAAYEGLDLFTRDRKVQRVIQERYLESLAFGAELGATHMVIHSPFVSFGNAFAAYTPASRRQPVIDTVQHILSAVLPTAEQMGCTLVIECILDKHPQPLIDLVASFDSPLVRVSIDVGHAFIMHQDGGASPDEWIANAGELLGHLHLQDNNGHADYHWAVGDGEINWRAVFWALRHNPAQPRLILEVAEVMRSFEYLRGLGLVR
jgi:sugar phosphate isomerase/epimerase